MWDLPRPGFEPVYRALAGGFLTAVPPGKPKSCILHSWVLYTRQHQAGQERYRKRTHEHSSFPAFFLTPTSGHMHGLELWKCSQQFFSISVNLSFSASHVQKTSKSFQNVGCFSPDPYPHPIHAEKNIP